MSDNFSCFIYLFPVAILQHLVHEQFYMFISGLVIEIKLKNYHFKLTLK